MDLPVVGQIVPFEPVGQPEDRGDHHEVEPKSKSGSDHGWENHTFL
jgi:hypothetical protein